MTKVETAQLIEFVQQHKGEYSKKELAEKLNKDYAMVSRFLRAKGLKEFVKKDPKKKNPNSRTSQLERILSENPNKYTLRELAEMTGMTYQSVRQTMSYFKWKGNVKQATREVRKKTVTDLPKNIPESDTVEENAV